MYAIRLAATGFLLMLVGCNGNEQAVGGSGLIEAEEVLISAEASGRLLERRFDLGDAVNVGDTLALIDPSRLELEISSVEAGLAVLGKQLMAARLQVETSEAAARFAQRESERVGQLLQSGNATPQQGDKIEYELSQANLALKIARAGVATIEAESSRVGADLARVGRALDDCYPIAPVSGLVTEEFSEVGELVSPGKPLVRLSRLDTVSVKIYLTTGRFATVKLGDRATVSTESGGQSFVGQIVWTSDEAEFTPKNVQTEESRADLVYAIKVSIPNRERTLKIGMPVFVTLER